MRTDLAELEKGMELTKREYEARKGRDPPTILQDFLSNSEDKLKKLKQDSKTAQVSDDWNRTLRQPRWVMIETGLQDGPGEWWLKQDSKTAQVSDDWNRTPRRARWMMIETGL